MELRHDLLRFESEGVLSSGCGARKQRVARIVLDSPTVADRRNVYDVAASTHEGRIGPHEGEQPPRGVVDLILEERQRCTATVGKIIRVARQRPTVDQPC